MPDSEFSEQQAADLLRRAALIQARQEANQGSGLTLDEVKHAAEVAGIDPLFVEQAALGAGDDLPPSEPFLGMQTGARRTRVVPGRVSDAEWGKMVATLRRQLGGTGEVETIGEVREWRRDPYHILLEPEGENTRISATARWRADAVGAVALSAMMVGLVAMMTIAGFESGKTAMFGFAGVFALATLASIVAFWPRLWAKGPRIEARFDRALGALAELAGSEERAAVLAEAPEIPSGAHIDPALLDLDPEASGPARTRTPRERS